MWVTTNMTSQSLVKYGANGTLDNVVTGSNKVLINNNLTSYIHEVGLNNLLSSVKYSKDNVTLSMYN